MHSALYIKIQYRSTYIATTGFRKICNTHVDMKEFQSRVWGFVMISFFVLLFVFVLFSVLLLFAFILLFACVCFLFVGLFVFACLFALVFCVGFLWGGGGGGGASFPSSSSSSNQANEIIILLKLDIFSNKNYIKSLYSQRLGCNESYG